MHTRWLKLTAIILLSLWLGACAQLGERSLKTDFDTRPQLGVRLRVVTGDEVPSRMPRLSAQQSQALLPDKPPQALLVVRVNPEQSAARAGILVGDYLIALQGNAVTGMRDSVALMQALSWGDDLYVTILRGQQLQEFIVPLRP